MKNTKRETYSIIALMLGICALCWILLLINPGNIMTVAHCHLTLMGPSQASWQMLLQMNPFSHLMAGWLLMVLAMMLPKLIIPIHYIYARSLKRLRLPLSVIFVWGYLTVWAAAGFLLNAVILRLNLLMPMSYTPALVVGFIALVWQFSPVKQHCLNKGHDHMPLSAFGWPAKRDALKFGIAHGLWCVGSGWALMLFPMLLHTGHEIGMMIVTLVMISEHMEHPRFPRWRFDFRLKLLRIIVARTNIRRKATPYY